MATNERLVVFADKPDLHANGWLDIHWLIPKRGELKENYREGLIFM